MLPGPEHGFDDPAQLDAFLDAVRWGAVASADTTALQAPFRSGIQIEDYQLDPVVRALSMPRTNLLIADDVGLGKTIEAGLVMQELMLRHRARTMLIVCPAGLTLQWRDEMRDKFGLDFRIVDAELLRELRRVARPAREPVDALPAADRQRRLAQARPADAAAARGAAGRHRRYPRTFDLLVVDEVHTCAPAGRGQVRGGLAAHQGDPHAGAALRAPAVPVRDPAQRLPGVVHRAAGAARRPALRPRREARPTSSWRRSWCAG